MDKSFEKNKQNSYAALICPSQWWIQELTDGEGADLNIHTTADTYML